MFTYHIFNLIIKSDVEIPIFKKSNIPIKKFDISVKFFSENLKIFNFDQKKIFFSKGDIFYEDRYGTKFIISHKSINRPVEVLIHSKNYEIKNIWESFISIPLGYALSVKGFDVTHGSAVSIGKSAACIFGFSGQGKSTLALSLLNKGFKFLTEDLCVFNNNKIYPFNSWIKTTDELIKDLDIKIESKKKLQKDSRSRNFFRIPKKNLSEKCNPKIAYFLAKDEKKSIKKLSKSEAFEFLFSHFYRFDNKKSSDLQRISNMLESLDFYIYKRDINAPIEENSEYLSNHIKGLIG